MQTGPAPINMGQVDYKDVLSMYDAGVVENTNLDRDSDTWVIKCKGQCSADKKGGKVWYDNATTLKDKCVDFLTALSDRLSHWLARNTWG